MVSGVSDWGAEVFFFTLRLGVVGVEGSTLVEIRRISCPFAGIGD
jgi:hypothetical protein